MKIVGLYRFIESYDQYYEEGILECMRTICEDVYIFPSELEEDQLANMESLDLNKFIESSDVIITNSNLPGIGSPDKLIKIICFFDFNKDFVQLNKYLQRNVDVYSINKSNINVIANYLGKEFFKIQDEDRIKFGLPMLNFLREKVVKWILSGRNSELTDLIRIMRKGKITNQDIVNTINKDY